MLSYDRPSVAGPKWFGHPAGLFLLAGVELWERFSFYGMRALLVLYMVTDLLPRHHNEIFGLSIFCSLVGLHPDVGDFSSLVSCLYGLYSGFVYFTPLLGGFLADKWFGKTALIISGGILLVIGHLILATPALFLIALMLIVLGTGGIKGNIAAQIGSLYEAHDNQREQGFSLFYVGINIGATAAPIVCGLLAQYFGWNVAFAATSVGMIFGLLLYIAGSFRLLPQEILKEALPTVSPDKRRSSYRVWPFLCLLVSCVLIWISYEQQANALMRWLVSSGSQQVSSVWIQAVPPIVVLLGTPCVMYLWSLCRRKNMEPDPVWKMVVGAAVLAGAQAALLCIASFSGQKPPSLMLVVAYMAMWEIGDLLFSPAAMGVFSRIGQQGRNAVSMALWYLTYFAANILSGAIGGWWGYMSPALYWFFIFATTLVGFLGILLYSSLHARPKSCSAV